MSLGKAVGIAALVVALSGAMCKKEPAPVVEPAPAALPVVEEVIPIPEPVVPEWPKKHIVQPGDTGTKIAQLYSGESLETIKGRYNIAGYWNQIAVENGLKKDNYYGDGIIDERGKVGDELTIPKYEPQKKWKFY